MFLFFNKLYLFLYRTHVKLAQWCEAVYQGDAAKASELLKSRYNPQDTTPWEATYRDTNFDLIVRLFR